MNLACFHGRSMPLEDVAFCSLLGLQMVLVTSIEQLGLFSAEKMQVEVQVVEETLGRGPAFEGAARHEGLGQAFLEIQSVEPVSIQQLMQKMSRCLVGQLDLTFRAAILMARPGRRDCVGIKDWSSLVQPRLAQGWHAASRSSCLLMPLLRMRVGRQAVCDFRCLGAPVATPAGSGRDRHLSQLHLRGQSH